MENACPPEDAVGIWIGRIAVRKVTGDEASVELHLFHDGKAFLRAHWRDDETDHAVYGTYRYNSETGKLWLDTGKTFGLIVTEISGSPATFTIDSLVFMKINRIFHPETPIVAGDVVGTWEQSFLSINEPSELILTIHSGGTFTETTRYGDSEDLISETGSWHLNGNNGLIEFHYSRSQDADYTALVNPDEGSIIAPIGVFRRIPLHKDL